MSIGANHDPTADIDERNMLRDSRILEAARSILLKRGLAFLTRDAIADQANVSAASVSNFARHRITNGSHDSLGYRQRIMTALLNDALAANDIAIIRICVADGSVSRDTLPGNIAARL